MGQNADLAELDPDAWDRLHEEACRELHERGLMVQADIASQQQGGQLLRGIDDTEDRLLLRIRL